MKKNTNNALDLAGITFPPDVQKPKANCSIGLQKISHADRWKASIQNIDIEGIVSEMKAGLRRFTALSFSRKLAVCFLFFLSGGFINPVKAAHLKGGYIEYAYVGPTPGRPTHARFKVTVFQYLDCNSQGGQIDADISLGVFDAGGNTLDTTYTIPLSGSKIINRQSFRCIVNPPVVCYRIDSYTRDAVDVPIHLSGTILCVQRCCRIDGIINITQSNVAGVSYTVKLNYNTTTNAYLSNASPVFAQQDTALVCASNSFTFPFQASDAEGDSLVYSFTPGLNTPTSQARPVPPLNPPFPDLSYSSGFSAGTPLGSMVTIDAKTGTIGGIAPAIAGQYVLAVMVEEYRNGVSIAISRKEIHVTVGNCDIPRAELPKNIINCSNYTVPFQNLSNSAGILSYYWDFGVSTITTDTSISPTPVYVYADTGIYIAKLVVNREGFCPDSTTTEVRVYPKFKAAFDVTGVCTKIPYQFTDRSTATFGAVKDWFWNFGDPSTLADTSRLKNPVYNYSTPGTYNIQLVTGSTKGCGDSTTTTITVLGEPKVQLAFRDTLICSIDTLQLNALAPGNYTWRPNQYILGANTANPLVFPKDTITYYVDLNDRGCIGTDSVTVNVLDFITVDAGRDTTICTTDAAILRPITHALSFLWTPDITLNNGRARSPIARPTEPSTTYYVTANLGKCQDRDSVTVRTVNYPIVDAGADIGICFNDNAQLNGSTNGSFYSWTPANLARSPNSISTVVSPRVTTPFVLTVTDNKGCPKPVSDTMIVTVAPRLTIFAGNDTSVVIGQPLQLNASSNATAFLWTPATGLNQTDILNPVATITAGLLPPGSDSLITYTVTGSTPQGCVVRDEIKVKIFKTLPTIFVPSGFTPNGDGRNDVIRPILAGIKQLDYFRVFNRYGQLIFETRTAGKGWDGRIKGELQGTAAFVYACQGVDYLGKTVQATGTFTLVR